MTPLRTTTRDRFRSLLTGRPAEAYAVDRERERLVTRSEAAALSILNRQTEAVELFAGQVDYYDRFSDSYPGTYGGLAGREGHRGGRDVPLLTTDVDLDFHRTTSRVLYDTNDYYRGPIDRCVDYTCGKGFAWAVHLAGQAADANADQQPPEVQRAQMDLDAFRRRDKWRSREREIETRAHRDGEYFLRLFRSAPGRPPAARGVNPELVRTPLCASDPLGPWSFGVLTHPDDVEKHLAYHVIDPNNPAGDGEVVLAGGLLPDEIAEAHALIQQLTPGLSIGAGRIYHYKKNTDRDVKRGLPTLIAAAAGSRSALKLIENVTDTAALQAAIYMIRRHAGASKAAVSAFASDYATSGVKLALPAAGSTGGMVPRNVPAAAQRGSVVIDSTDQTEYDAGPTSTGTPNYLAAQQAMLRKTGVRLGAPEYLVSGDASNGNYSSTKEAGSPFVVSSEGRQMDLADFEEDIAYCVLELTGAAVPGIVVAITPPDVAITSALEGEQINAIQHQNRVLSATSWQKRANLPPEVERANFKLEDDLNPDAGPMLGLGDDDSTVGGLGFNRPPNR